jgi:hypothetical protein
MEIPVSKIFDVAHLLYKLEKLALLREILDQSLGSGIADYRLFVMSGLTHLAAEEAQDSALKFEEAVRRLPASNSTVKDLKAALEDRHDRDNITQLSSAPSMPIRRR